MSTEAPTKVEVYIDVGVPGTPRQISVRPDPQKAHTGNEVDWHVKCDDADVSHVEIEFADTGDEFFASSPAGQQHKRKEPLAEDKSAIIVGNVPKPAKANSQKSCKYSIWIYSKTPTQSTDSLDPIIITVDP